MNNQGRPTAPVAANLNERLTVSGSKGLDQAERLIFEVGTPRRTGVDLPEPKGRASRLGGHERKGEIGLPGLSEPETLRHYVRLSQKNYAIARLNEKVARLPGFADVHPFQPESTVQGALELMHELSHWLMTLCNMPAVALTPKAGATLRASCSLIRIHVDYLRATLLKSLT